MIASACGHAPVEVAAPQRAGWEGALVELLPDGANVVVLARPDALIEAPASRRVVTAIASDERLERYRQRTGIDPRTLEELAWAETDEGSVLVVRGPFNAPLAVAEMGARMLPVEASVDEPFVRRVGHYEGAHRDLVAVADHVLLAITGPPSLSQAVMARVRGEDVGPRELSRAVAASLLEDASDAPFLVLVPRPLRMPPGSGIALLLAREEALVGTLVPSGAAELALSLDLRGEFPPGADQNFRALVASLAESDLGSAIGMRDALPTLRVEADDVRVMMRATVPSAAIAAGLRAMFDAEIAELIAMPDSEGGVGGPAASR